MESPAQKELSPVIKGVGFGWIVIVIVDESIELTHAVLLYAFKETTKVPELMNV